MQVPTRLYVVSSIIALGFGASQAIAGYATDADKCLQAPLIVAAEASSDGALEDRNNNRHLGHSRVECQGKEVCSTWFRDTAVQGYEPSRKSQGKRYTKFMGSHSRKKTEW